MSPEKWQTIKETARKQFSIIEEGRGDLVVDTAEGPRPQGQAEFIVFETPPLGKIKLEFQKKPRVEEKKFFYSHRQGDAARVEYKYSDKEFVYLLKAYLWNEAEDNWKEIDASSFA